MGDVQLGEQERRQQEPDRRRRAHIGRRAGWAVFGLVLAAALAGLIGPGPLSRATASAALVHVEYERFARQLGVTSLELTVRPDPARPDAARLWISNDYLSKLGVQQVVPEPESWTAARGGVVLAFPLTGDEARVTIQASPDHVGPLRGAIGTPGRPPAEVWQFVYP